MNTTLIHITTYTTTSIFDDIAPQWNALVERSINNTPFATVQWNQTWWQAYQPGELWVAVCENDAQQIIGIAPWFIEKQADNTSVLRFIGHVDVTDYLDLIVDSQQQTLVYEHFADFLRDNRDQFDMIALANIPDASPTRTIFADMLRERGFTVDFELNDVAPIIELPSSYDVYLKEQLDSKQRKEVKRKMRRAEGGEYAVDWYIVNKDHNLSEQTDLFLQLMESADREKAEFLQNPQHVDFFRQIVPLAAEAGWLQLVFVTVDGEACAAYVNFDYNNRIYVYNSGLAPDKYGALSPGIVLLQYTIQDAIEKQRSVFDFLRGNETYKYHMGGKDTHVYQLNAS